MATTTTPLDSILRLVPELKNLSEATVVDKNETTHDLWSRWKNTACGLKTKKTPTSSSVAAWKRWAWTKLETSKRVIEKNIGDCTRWVRPSCYDDVASILPCDKGSHIPPPCENRSCDNNNCNNNTNGDGYGSVSSETEVVAVN